MKGNIWQVAVVALACALALPALNVAQTNATVQGAENESVTVDYTNNSTVSADAVSFNETVTITSEGTTLTDGTDYEWYHETGTVEWYNTSSTTEGDTAWVDYTYQYRTQETEDVSGMLASVSPVLGLLLLITGLGALLVISWGGGAY